MLLFSMEKPEFPFFELPYFRVLPSSLHAACLESTSVNHCLVNCALTLYFSGCEAHANRAQRPAEGAGVLPSGDDVQPGTQDGVLQAHQELPGGAL